VAPVLRTLALAVVVALAGASTASAKVGDLYALRYGAKMSLLVPYDPVRLVPSGGAIRTGNCGQAWSVSADRKRFAAAVGWRLAKGKPAELCFVDLAHGRVDGRMSLPGEHGRVAATAWARGNVLAVVTGGTSTTVYSVDPDRRRVLGKVEVEGALVGGERSPNGLVLLLERPDVIGPATIAVVDPRPRARIVVVERITVGHTSSGEDDERLVTILRPGLALAPAGDQVYLFGTGEPGAAIDLRTLAVRYSPVRGTTSIKKNVTGSVRTAAALPDGRVVVSGYSFGAAGPAYLHVVDPKDWSSRPLGSAEAWFRVAGGMVFTRGPGGTGLRMWKPSGEAVALFPTGSVGGVFVVGERAFVTFIGTDTKAAVVELGTGRVVRHTVPAHPLIGPGQPITG
jgi:hypothetical protein